MGGEFNSGNMGGNVGMVGEFDSGNMGEKGGMVREFENLDVNAFYIFKGLLKLPFLYHLIIFLKQIV